VSYSYQIGTYDVTGSQYTAFLNAVGSTDTYVLYNTDMGEVTNVAQISRSGSSGTYTYAVMNSTGSRPISYMTWFNSARFSNWMSNGQPRGAQSSTTTENGAYNVNGATYGNAVAANSTNPNTGLPPTYRIPLENEWYKAAYYSPNYGGSGVGGYYTYATQSNVAPGNTIGSSPNQANYANALANLHATDVGSFSGSGSFYGTFDQSGNVWQYNDLNGNAGAAVRGVRGGSWATSNSEDLSSSGRKTNTLTGGNQDPAFSIIGFRLASPVTTTLTPTFGAKTRTATGFTVPITNYDSSYTWAGTATASGTVVVSSTGLVTVTGVAAVTSSTATITTTKAGTVGGSATVTATSLAAALTPTFGSTTATADGFTVPITNYDSSYTWAGTATASGLLLVSSTGLVTVTGVAPGTSSTATITTTRTGYASGSATVTATSVVGTALTPAFGATTSTATGFTVQIANYNASYTWAGTATASGSVLVSGTGLVTITGVAVVTSSTATITTTRAGYIGGSATVTATSLTTMSMVTVGYPGNVADTTGYGAVSYSYQIGAYDVTGSQYTAFLNAVGRSDTYGLYNTSMGTDTDVAQISRSGTSGTYTYAVLNGTGNRPITYVSWFDSARFSNWMSNGQPSGAQTSTTTENGAYNLNGAIAGNSVASNATNPNTGLAPTYRMPLENEWYKAAYYSPNRGGSGIGGYYPFATQSNVAPGTTIGSGANQANYNDAIGRATDVGAFSGSGSYYGTFDQSGNVWQWNDLDGTPGSSLGIRGGSWAYPFTIVSSVYHNDGVAPSTQNSSTGFRLASSVVTTTLTPTFGASYSTADGFVVPITNFDSSYTWAGTATASGSVAINGSGLVTVTGVNFWTSSTATITTTKLNTVGGSAQVTAVPMSMVTVGDVGNAAKTISFGLGSPTVEYGAVAYSYQIGAYDVTGAQYAAFLNAVGSTDTYGLYNANMGTDPNDYGVAQISQSGSSGSYTYAVLNGTGRRPITYVSWFDSARFSNWMSNGQPSGAQTSTTTENGAYNLNGATTGNAVAKNATNPNTGSAPTYRIPLENEWFKAAYYKGGSTNAGYFDYATQSNSTPGTTIGSSANQANYGGPIGTNNAIGHATNVGAFSGSGSFYGTFDQSGNVCQWNDLGGTAGSTRGRRGGDWDDQPLTVSLSWRSDVLASDENANTGFRLASPDAT